MMFAVVVRLRLSLWVALVCIGPGCGQKAAAPMNAAAAAQHADGWTLISTDPNSGTPALLWNGLIGVRIGTSGNAFDLFLKELPCFAIDAYEQEGFEKIIPLRGLLGYRIESASSDLFVRGEDDKAAVQDYKQTLDLRTGLLRTSWRESAATALYPNRLTDAQVETVIHPTLPVIAQRFTLRQTHEAHFRVFEMREENAAEASFGARTIGPAEVESTAVLHAGKIVVSRIRAVSGQSSIEADKWGAAVDVDHADGESAVIERVAWLVDSGEEPQSLRYEDVAKASRTSLEKRWETDIEIDGPIEDQLAVRSWLFYLRSAIHPQGTMSLSPMGLSSTDYNGHVFWDADLWVFPALALLDPDAAKKIPEYRLSQEGQYGASYKQWREAGRPIAKGSLDAGPPIGDFDWKPAVMVPWESSVSGKEVSPLGDWRYQHHATGTAAFALGLANDLGLAGDERTERFIEGAASFFRARMEGSPGEIKRTMSPDEHHIADNDLYTNLVAQWCLNRGSWPGEFRMKLPRDDSGFLTYDGDPVRSYKQAAAVLAIYPLQYPPAEAEARQMMDRFADKVIDNGPAMSDAIHATIWARLGEPERAYETWRAAWQEFARPPHLLFSETRSRDETYFTTGAGGCLQTVLYGFLGFRIDSKVQPGSVWSRQLKGDRWLSAKPQLPKAWKRVTIRNFSVLGERATLTVTPEGVEATRGE